MIKRVFDVVLAVVLIAVLALPILLIAMLVRLTSPGPAIYWSDRVGRNKRIFRMPKFRSMYTDTPAVATHLLTDAAARITPLGRVLRRTSLDELPQLWSVLKGDMSFVGPRPALYNQYDLIELRERRNVNALRPGVTGWAQVNGRDELDIPTKVEFDANYAERQSLVFDLKILWLTIWNVVAGRGIHH